MGRKCPRPRAPVGTGTSTAPGPEPFARLVPIARLGPIGSNVDTVRHWRPPHRRVTRGAYDIALTYAQSGDFNLTRTSDVVELGGVATFSVTYGGGSAVVVLKYEHGRITQAVVMAP